MTEILFEVQTFTINTSYQIVINYDLQATTFPPKYLLIVY